MKHHHALVHLGLLITLRKVDLHIYITFRLHIVDTLYDVYRDDNVTRETISRSIFRQNYINIY